MMAPEAAETGDAFLTDEFMLNEFKVTPCDRGFRHNWRRCPHAHDGETARRRDPKVFNYKAVICPETKKKEECPRGSACPCAHNVFEYWLLPSRFKTELCKHGSKAACKLKRSFCFFAHSRDELRPLQEIDDGLSLDVDISGKSLENLTLPISGGESHHENNSQHWPISAFFEDWDMDMVSSNRIQEHTAQYPQPNSILAMSGAVTPTNLFDMSTTNHGGCNPSGPLHNHQDFGQIRNDYEKQKKLPFNLGYFSSEEIAAVNTAHEMRLPPHMARPVYCDSYMVKKSHINCADEFPSMRIMKILSSNLNQNAWGVEKKLN